MGIKKAFVKAGDTNIHYLVAGEGPPLLLLHGLGGSLSWWTENIEPLAQSFRVYALDLLGHGLSDKPKTRYDLLFGCQILLDFITALNLERASIVGHSTGGLLALEFALFFPERVNRLVLVDSAGLGREVDWLLRLVSLPLLGELLSIPNRFTLRIFLRRLFQDPRFVTEELVERAYQERSQPGAIKALLRILREGVGLWGLKDRVLRLEELPRLSVPVLILWGEQDRILPLFHAYAAHRLLHPSQLYTFPHCGHCPQIERADEFNHLVLRFLTERR